MLVPNDVPNEHKPADGLRDVLDSNNSSSTTVAVGLFEGKKDSSTVQLEQGDSTALPGESGFPDGGWQAWACLFGAWWMIFFSFGSVNAFGVFQQYYAQQMLPDKTMSEISWIGSFQLFFVFGSGAVAGRAFDLGYLKPLLSASILLLVFCQMMVSLCTQYWQLFLAQGVGLGLAMGFVFNLSIATPSHWFLKRRATAMGILASGAGVGSTVIPIMVRQLIPAVGFPWTMRIIAFATLIILCPCFFLLQTRLPPRKAVCASDWVDLSAFKMRSYSFFVVGAAMIMFGIYTPQTYMNTFTSVHAIPADGYWLSVLNAAGIFGRLIPGILADRYGKMTTLLPHLCIATLLLFLFPLFSNLSIIAFALLFGYCCGCYVSLLPSCVNQLGTTSSAGSRMGTLFSIMSIAGLFGTPIAGLVMGNAPYHWWACVAYSGSCVTVGLVFIFLARHYAARVLPSRP